MRKKDRIKKKMEKTKSRKIKKAVQHIKQKIHCGHFRSDQIMDMKNGRSLREIYDEVRQ